MRLQSSPTRSGRETCEPFLAMNTTRLSRLQRHAEGSCLDTASDSAKRRARKRRLVTRRRPQPSNACRCSGRAPDGAAVRLQGFEVSSRSAGKARAGRSPGGRADGGSSWAAQELSSSGVSGAAKHVWAWIALR